MKLSRLMILASLLGLLSLNGCMLGHLFSDDESGMHSGGMGMHDGMGMMHSSDGEEDTSSEESSYE
ncbi:hypothetical protein [Ghiorsea bivora]|uniref:hypothetical protein n=1 Tax=Ghiorsea bivora TaxID=1485545 RepID=UPI00056FAE82|nr:hypothetical protein [Ghiorsea bivora]